MPAPSEPEKFSIDEMMERLKNRPSEDPIEDGELVTRADGTQAIRVRKRKRRSQQPHKEQLRRVRRARMIQASGAIILLLMAGFAIGSAIVYANSAPFRESVLRMIQSSSGARAELEQFRVSPTQANAGRLVLTWPDESIIKQLSVRGVAANIAPSSFFGKSLSGEEINSNEATLRLGLAESTGSATRDAGKDAPPPIRFKRYAVTRLAVGIGNPERPVLLLRDTEASFQPDNAKERPQLLLSRGTVSAPGWPNIKLDRAHIEFRDREIDIIGMRLVNPQDYRSVMDFAGTIEPHIADRQATLAVRMESFLLSGIIGPEIDGLFEGRIETATTPQSNELTFFPGPEPDARLKLSFRKSVSTPIELRGFKFLSQLAILLNDNWFEKPVFEMDAAGTILRTGDGVAIENLDFEQRGRMALRGGIRAGADRRLSGKLEVGISEAMLKSADNRRLESLFDSGQEGFRWITLTISGNSKSPADNFMELYDAATTSSAVPGTQGIPTFEDLIAPE